MLGELPVPGQPLLERLVVAAGPPRPLQVGALAGQVLGEPAADLGAEGLVLGAVAQVHVWYPTKQMLGLVRGVTTRSRRCSAAPRSGSATTRRTSRADRTVCRTPTCSSGCGRRPGRLRRRTGSARATGSSLWGPNSIEWAVAALASTYAGGSSCPPTPATPATRWPTWSTAPTPRSWSSPTASSVAPRSPSCAPRAPVDRRSTSSTRCQPRRRAARATRRVAAPSRLARRRRRHPLHLRHHRALQGRDERAPADHRRRAGLGRARRGQRRTTATSWSTRSSTPSATRSASSSACSPAPRSTRSRPSTSTRRCR